MSMLQADAARSRIMAHAQKVMAGAKPLEPFVPPSAAPSAQQDTHGGQVGSTEDAAKQRIMQHAQQASPQSL